MKTTLFSRSNTSSRTIALSLLAEQMRSEKYAKTITNYRKTLQRLLPGETCPTGKLPLRVCFSSLFNGKQNDCQWTNYTGLVPVVVDNLENGREINELRQKAMAGIPTVMVWKGADGKSLCILARFTRSDGNLPVTPREAELFHVHALRQATGFYQMLLDRPIAGQAQAISGSFFVSHDPDLYFNPQAVAVTIEQPLEMPAIPKEHQSSETSGASDPLEKILPADTPEERIAFLFDIALQETIRETGPTEEEEPESFLIRLAEYCFRSGIPEEEAIKRARFYSRLGIYETRVRTVFRNVYQLEQGFGRKPVMPAVQLLAFQLEEFIQRRYKLRKNTLKKNVEYRERAALLGGFRPVNDEVLNTISLQAHLEGLNFWDRDVKRYVYSNRVTAFNPLDDYLYSLPTWDGQDHIKALADTLPTDHPYWPLCFYRWFLAMVAQWKGLNPMHGNCVVPLLSGAQATGKSTWCKQILPPELQDYYAENLDLTERRNAHLALNRFALINLDEFDSIPESKQPLLKHLLQLPEIALRRPHSGQTEILPRYASFIATCNPTDVLTDPTGSRRFLCVTIRERISAHSTIDYAQLYAQAMAALRRGERYWFDHEEEQTLMNHNESFSVSSPEEQLLLLYFQPLPPEEEEGEWLSAIQLLQYLRKQGKINLSRTSLTSFGRILQKHRFARKHTVQGNFYKVKRLG